MTTEVCMGRASMAVVVFTLACTGNGMAAEATWSQWRGPERDGRSDDKGLLKEWPTGGPALLWQGTGIGEGFASAVVGGDMVFTAGKIGGDMMITAFDLGGKRLWQVKHGPAWTADYPGSRATPTYDDGLLYFLSGPGLLTCHKAKTGQAVWSVDITREFGGRPPGWGYSESVLVTGRMAVVTPGGSKCIVALDKLTGKVIWTSGGLSDPVAYSSCIAFTFKGVPMICTMTAKGMVGVLATDGRFLWRNDRAAGATAVCPSPVYSDGYVFGASGYGNGGACVKLSVAGGRVEATQAWDTKEMVNHHGCYVIVDGHIYGFHDGGSWNCLELATGRKVWGDRGVGKGSICYADGMLYMFSENGGHMGLAPATPSGYTMRGELRVPGGGQSWAHPAVTGGRLYARYADNLCVYNIRDPRYKPPVEKKPEPEVKRPPPAPEPSFRRAVKPLPPATPEVKAERLLKMAENFLVNGARSMAKAKFQEVVDKYPDTEAAKTARRKLRGM
jgi:outer membrane protein assembly factor BamB